MNGADLSTRCLAEAALMQEWGGRTQIVPRLPALSTTALVERLRRPWRSLAPVPGHSAWIEP